MLARAGYFFSRITRLPCQRISENARPSFYLVLDANELGREIGETHFSGVHWLGNDKEATKGGGVMAEWCNCESLVCKMPHADGSRESLDTRDWVACSNPSRDDLRIMYIGPVCEGCYQSYPTEYRMARNPVQDWWGGDTEHAVEDLWLFIENTRELYEPKKRILADPRVYDPRLAPYVWLSWVNLGAQMYVHEMILDKPLSRFYRSPPPPDVVEQYIPLPIREELVRQVAEHEYIRLIHEQGYAPPIKRVVYTGGPIRKNPRFS